MDIRNLFVEIGMRVVFLEINISRERIREERLRRFDYRYQR